MRKLVLGMSAMDGVNAANAGAICRPSPSKRQKLNATAHVCGVPAVPYGYAQDRLCYSCFIPDKGYKTCCAMTPRFRIALHNTTQTALREIAQRYRFWGLLGFPPRSEG